MNDNKRTLRAEAPEDLHYNWDMLRLPPDTNFPVPSTEAVQHMASTLLSKVASLQGRDNHDAKFVLAMTSLWQDLSKDDRNFVFQRLNLISILTAPLLQAPMTTTFLQEWCQKHTSQYIDSREGVSSHRIKANNSNHSHNNHSNQQGVAGTEEVAVKIKNC